MGPREPTTPSPYWLTLDVFNAGDNLPCQTTGNDVSSDATSTDDWRVPIAWGRTLVALTYEVTRQQSTLPSLATARPLTPRAQQPHPHTTIPPPTLAAHRHHGAAHRGQPRAHARHAPGAPHARCGPVCPRDIPHPPTPPTPMPTFTYTHMHTHVCGAPLRPHMLFTLASEVLAVAERLEDTGLHACWATWAVFL
jgi:hypothetical protein